MSRAADYSDDAIEVKQGRDYTPRATSLLSLVYEAQGEVLDAEKRQKLEVLEYALGLHTRFREDLSDAGVLSFRTRLQRITGKAAE